MAGLSYQFCFVFFFIPQNSKNSVADILIFLNGVGI